jgi:hypothetical protein
VAKKGQKKREKKRAWMGFDPGFCDVNQTLYQLSQSLLICPQLVRWRWVGETRNRKKTMKNMQIEKVHDIRRNRTRGVTNLLCGGKLSCKSHVKAHSTASLLARVMWKIEIVRVISGKWEKKCVRRTREGGGWWRIGWEKDFYLLNLREKLHLWCTTQ